MSTAPITQSEQPNTGPQPVMAFTAGAIRPPDEADMLDWRTEPGPSALIWAVGCHGGAGVSTVAAQLEHVGNSGQRWPARTNPVRGAHRARIRAWPGRRRGGGQAIPHRTRAGPRSPARPGSHCCTTQTIVARRQTSPRAASTPATSS